MCWYSSQIPSRLRHEASQRIEMTRHCSTTRIFQGYVLCSFFLGLFSSLAILDILGRSWQVWSATGPAFPWWPEQRVSSSVTDSADPADPADPADECWDLRPDTAATALLQGHLPPATALDLTISHQRATISYYITKVTLFHKTAVAAPSLWSSSLWLAWKLCVHVLCYLIPYILWYLM